MTFLEAKKIVEGKGYHVVKNSEGESFRQRVAHEELEEAMKVVKQAGLNVINENDLTNFAQFDSNGNINASQDFEDDKMILSANFNDNTDDEDMSPYDAELTIQFKKKKYILFGEYINIDNIAPMCFTLSNSIIL